MGILDFILGKKEKAEKPVRVVPQEAVKPEPARQELSVINPFGYSIRLERRFAFECNYGEEFFIIPCVFSPKRVIRRKAGKGAIKGNNHLLIYSLEGKMFHIILLQAEDGNMYIHKDAYALYRDVFRMIMNRKPFCKEENFHAWNVDRMADFVEWANYTHEMFSNDEQFEKPKATSTIIDLPKDFRQL